LSPTSANSDGVVFRAAAPGDAPAMAALANIDAGPYKLEEYLGSDAGHGFVVFEGAELIAWAIARDLLPAVVDSDHAPPGWYLMGVVVRPDRRRRGLGAQLTQARLDWLAGKTTHVRYFTQLTNQASVALHQQLGFVHVRDGLTTKGLAFNGGEYSLFELDMTHTDGDQ